MPQPVAVRPEFATWLTSRRRASGLSQRELAGRLGVGERTVRAWEAEEMRPSGRSLHLIAAATGVSIARLVDYRDAENYRPSLRNRTRE